MKYVIVIILIDLIFVLSLHVNCKLFTNIDGTQFVECPKGIFTMDDMNINVTYEISYNNIAYSCLMTNIPFAREIVIGWYLWSPVEYC